MEWFGSALDVAAAISSRQVSPTEVMEHYLARADALDGQLNAFALRDDDRALADARAATDLVG
jgi:amidase